MSWSNKFAGTVADVRTQVLNMEHASEDIKRGINRSLAGFDQSAQANLETSGHISVNPETKEPTGKGSFSVIFSTK